MASSLIVVNLRGTVNIPAPKKDALKQLGLTRRFRAVVVPDEPRYRGILRAIKNNVAWTKLDAELAEKLLIKRGRRTGWRPLTEDDLKAVGFKSFRELALALERGETSILSKKPFKHIFSLHPPRGGFKRSSRRMYSEGGLLGENPELSKLLETML